MTEQVKLIIRAKLLIDGLGGPPVAQGLVAIAGNKIMVATERNFRATASPPPGSFRDETVFLSNCPAPLQQQLRRHNQHRQ